MSARELIRETNYDLTELAKTQLGVERPDFDVALIPNFFRGNAEKLMEIVKHTEKDA